MYPDLLGSPPVGVPGPGAFSLHPSLLPLGACAREMNSLPVATPSQPMHQMWQDIGGGGRKGSPSAHHSLSCCPTQSPSRPTSLLHVVGKRNNLGGVLPLLKPKSRRNPKMRSHHLAGLSVSAGSLGFLSRLLLSRLSSFSLSSAASICVSLPGF